VRSVTDANVFHNAATYYTLSGQPPRGATALDPSDTDPLQPRFAPPQRAPGSLSRLGPRSPSNLFRPADSQRSRPDRVHANHGSTPPAPRRAEPSGTAACEPGVRRGARPVSVPPRRPLWAPHSHTGLI
jgi:hypothetical protein